MADTKVSALTTLTTPTTDDLLLAVDDPTGTPVTKALSILNLSKLLISNVAVQVLAGTSYTPTTGARKTLWICVGGGGAGAPVSAGADADVTSGGGGGGGTVIKLAASAAATIAIAAASTSGNGGNNTTVNTPAITASGGGVGIASSSATVGVQGAGGAGGAATGGDLNIPGEPGMRAVVYSTSDGCGGQGGDSVFGHGGKQSGTEAAGTAGGAYGGGGGGAHTFQDTSFAGGGGAAGVIYVIEFIG